MEERANPSCDFFVIPALTAQRLSYTRCLFHELVQAHALRNAIVIFIRYVPSPWQKLISAQRATIRHVIFFMDDDVLDVAAFAGISRAYLMVPVLILIAYGIVKIAPSHVPQKVLIDNEL